MTRVFIYLLCCVVLAGCSKIDSGVLDFIVPESYEYMVVDELVEESYFFGDPSSYFILKFTNNITSGPEQIFQNSQFELAYDSDLEYFKRSFPFKDRLSSKVDYQLFRSDVIATSQTRCSRYPCAVYLLTSKSDELVYIEVLAF